MINLTYENRSELLFSALAGAVFGVVSGYLEAGGSAYLGAHLRRHCRGMVYCLRAIR